MARTSDADNLVFEPLAVLDSTVLLNEAGDRDADLELVWVGGLPLLLEVVDHLGADLEVLVGVQVLLILTLVASARGGGSGLLHSGGGDPAGGKGPGELHSGVEVVERVWQASRSLLSLGSLLLLTLGGLLLLIVGLLGLASLLSTRKKERKKKKKVS